MKIWLCGEPECDLVRLFNENKIEFNLTGDPEYALSAGSTGDVLLLTAAKYPDEPSRLPESWRRAAADGSRNVYAEFCGEPDEEPAVAGFEREVVTTSEFGDKLAEMRILMVSDCHYLRRKNSSPWLVAAKVAGFDNALFGLPEQTWPLLYRFGVNGFMATSALSSFITGRFAPAEAWAVVWQTILSRLTGREIPDLHWTPDVAPSFSAAAVISDNDLLHAARRGAAWFEKSGLLMDGECRKQCKEGSNHYPDELNYSPARRKFCCGDGSLGMLEGANAKIMYDGSQKFNYGFRADCIGEASMALALAGKCFDNPNWQRYSTNLNNYLWRTSYFAQGPRADRASASFGLVAWMGNDVNNGVYYGDDNARMMLGCIGAASVLPGYSHLERLAGCLVGNMRTSGANGYRTDRLEDCDMQKNGWRFYFDREVVNYAPHFESWLWACYCWAVAHGGSDRFRSRAENGIAAMLENYPDNWKWTNGLQQERARMLLPLAWQVRMADTPEHRRQLEFMVNELLKYQDQCGAIREELGAAGKGQFAPCASNEAYGTAEAPLIQTNDDALSDLLYTTNFAFIGLHEAVAATGNPEWRKTEDRLAAFLARIQVSSGRHPDLDGGWFRAFDFKRHDYWGCNADAGWGVWSIESGWTQGWIVAVLCLRAAGTSLWDISSGLDMAGALRNAEATMIDSASDAAEQKNN